MRASRLWSLVPTPRRPELHAKVLANIQEVRARGARTIVIAEEGDASVDQFAEVVFRVPPVPTLYAATADNCSAADFCV